jgi:hypothetical protein
MRWQRAGKRSTNTNEKKKVLMLQDMQGEKGFVLLITLVLLVSSIMETTFVTNQYTTGNPYSDKIARATVL